MSEEARAERLPLGFEFVAGEVRAVDGPDGVARAVRDVEGVSRFWEDGKIIVQRVHAREATVDQEVEPADDLDRQLAEEMAIVLGRDKVRREAAGLRATAEAHEAGAKVPLGRQLPEEGEPDAAST